MGSLRSWLERAVKRGLKRREAEPVPRLGVDEKAFRKGQKYLTVVNDLTRNRVLYVAEDRKQSSLDGFWNTLSEEQQKGIEAVANGHVGSLRGIGACPRGGCRSEDRLRQIPRGAACMERAGFRDIQVLSRNPRKQVVSAKIRAVKKP